MIAARAVAAALLLSAGCASTPRPLPTARARPRPDLHGDPVALLPRGAVAWIHVDAAALRQSPHYEPCLSLWGAQAAELTRELGHDPLREGSRAALGFYLPPARGARGWPLLVAQGPYDRAAVLANARAHAPQSEPAEVREGPFTFTVVGQRAYLFAAPDVLVATDRALVRRVAARLAGEADGSMADDPRFVPHWERANGRDGALAGAVDLAALRAHGATSDVRIPVRGADANALTALVLRAEGPDGVTVRAVGEAASPDAATAVVQTVDEARREAADNLAARIFGLSRVLGEGIRVRTEGPWVLLDADATRSEASRILRAAAMLNRASE